MEAQEIPQVQVEQLSEINSELKSAMLASISDLTYYNLACVLYYLFSKDIALLSKTQDIWLHKINTENNKWEITDCSFIVNLIEQNMYNEFNKLYTHYSSLSQELNCPYGQSSSKIAEIMSNLASYSLDIIHEAKEFFYIEDRKAFIQYYLGHDNLVEVTDILLNNYIDC